MDEHTGESKTYPLQLRGLYRAVRGIIGFLLRTLSRFEVVGLEHVPDKGPYVLATNHLHWLDSPALMVALPHRAWVLAGEKWEKHWLLGPLMRSLDAIFVRRGEVDRKALRRALAVLEGGGVLGLAPEGTRSRTGGLQRGRHGPAYLVLRTGARVLPAVCTGQERVFPSLKQMRRARVRVVFGPAFEPEAAAVCSKPATAQVHALTDDIMYRLAAMLPAEYRGLYADVEERRPDLVAAYGNKHASSLREELVHGTTRK